MVWDMICLSCKLNFEIYVNVYTYAINTTDYLESRKDQILKYLISWDDRILILTFVNFLFYYICEIWVLAFSENIFNDKLIQQ